MQKAHGAVMNGTVCFLFACEGVSRPDATYFALGGKVTHSA